MSTAPDRSEEKVPTSARLLADRLARMDGLESAMEYRRLDKDLAVAVFDALDASEQARLIDTLRGPEVSALIEEMDPDDRVRLLDEMPAAIARRLLGDLSTAERDLTSLLLGYPPESAGRVMTPEYLELGAEQTVGEALDKIRTKGKHVDALDVLPVRDKTLCLQGAVRLVDLVRAERDAPLADVIDANYPSASADEDQEAAARLMQEEDLLALPIVDRERRLVGLLTVDDAMEVLEREGSEDLARVGASEPLRAPYHTVSIQRLVRSRIVWLLFLVAAASLTVSVLGAFEGTLEQNVTLALFIPLLIGTGGNCGAQAATTMTRALALGDVRFGDLIPSVLKEARVGLALGLIFALIGFPVISLIWTTDLAAVVCLTLLAICAWATSIGALLPLVSSRVGVDPAVVSAPLVTTLVDATGLLIYFLIADAILL